MSFSGLTYGGVDLGNQLQLNNYRLSLWQTYQRGIDTRSGNLVVRDDSGNILTVGVISSGSLGMEVLDANGNSIFNPVETDVTALQTKLGTGTDTPGLNEVLVGGAAGASAWQSSVTNLTLVTPTIANFTNATHDHSNAAGGGNIPIGSVTNLQSTLDGKVNDTGAETIAGVKTFSSFPVTPSAAPTTDYQVANKKYVDDSVTGASGSFTTVDGKTVTVTDGLITSIV